MPPKDTKHTWDVCKVHTLEVVLVLSPSCNGWLYPQLLSTHKGQGTLMPSSQTLPGFSPALQAPKPTCCHPLQPLDTRRELWVPGVTPHGSSSLCSLRNPGSVQEGEQQPSAKKLICCLLLWARNSTYGEREAIEIPRTWQCCLSNSACLPFF